MELEGERDVEPACRSHSADTVKVLSADTFLAMLAIIVARMKGAHAGMAVCGSGCEPAVVSVVCPVSVVNPGALAVVNNVDPATAIGVCE